MAFTVSRDDSGNRDAGFEAYLRLLHQQGIDLGKSPRTPEPGPGRRWLYVWESREKAQAFADVLKKRTRGTAWSVIEVAEPLSEGPLGPIIIQVGRRSTGLVFGLPSLSRWLIQSAIPNANVMVTIIAIDFESSKNFSTTRGAFENLVRGVVPTLTGLRLLDLDKLGYALIEEDNERTLLFVRPGDLDEAQVPSTMTST